jgi:hypothetical protein
MKHVGLKVFIAVIVILGFFNALSSLFSSDSGRSSTRRSGYFDSSGYKYSGGYSSKTTGTAPKATSTPPKATTKPRSTKPTSAAEDPFDAASYPHPDDFYYDHYNDFWDYEDAEEYWESHQ